MIHVEGRCILAGLSDNHCWHARCCRMRGYIDKDYRTRTNLGTITHCDVSKNFCACPNKNTTANLRVTIPTLFTCTTESNFMEEGNVIFDLGGFTRNEAGGMVEENACAETGRGMNIDG
jgi:hypothetical protein